MDSLCVLDSVSRSYSNGRPVVNDVSLSVRAGEMVAIVGPSGSGKSTLLNIMGLLDSPTTGEVKLFGSAAPRPNSRAARYLLRFKLGYLFQNFALIDSKSVEYNIRLALRYSGLNRAGQSDAVREVLGRLGLSGMSDKLVFQLSGGEQQRVAIARVLLKSCDLVLADEPTGSLDRENRDLVAGYLREMAENGRGVVIVTHDEEVARSSDRIIQLSSMGKSGGSSE